MINSQVLTATAAALLLGKSSGSRSGLCAGVKDGDDMPRPFTRVLQLQTPPMTGMDVYILQNLLKPLVPTLPATGLFGNETYGAVYRFQEQFSWGEKDGIVDGLCACEILNELGEDGYKDDGASAGSLGYLYKIHIPVYANRSVESTATLLDANNVALFNFTVRAHGMDAWQNTSAPWPYFNNLGVGLNAFSDGGNTPTGLTEVDLNSPEDNVTEFGPYPINRFVQGLKGNAAWIYTNNESTMVRDGILLHTGNWSEVGWQPPQSMPNSLGCVHAWPDSIKTVWQILTTQLGVQVRPNTDGALPYPYKPQGLISVEQVD